ncbi:PAS domain-containing protein [bacterium]|nr:PAS domain-containing protein [bacterium]
MDNPAILFTDKELSFPGNFLDQLKKIFPSLVIAGQPRSVSSGVVFIYANEASADAFLIGLNPQCTCILVEDHAAKAIAPNYLQRIDGYLNTHLQDAATLQTLVQHAQLVRQAKNQAATTTSHLAAEPMVAYIPEHGLSSERLKSSLEALNAGVWDWSYNLGKATEWWSARVYEILGYEPYSFEPTRELFEKLIHPDDLPTLNAEKERFLLNQDIFSVKVRMLTHRGDYLWIESNGKGEFDSKGQVQRIIGTIADIDKREKESREFELHRLQFQKYIESAPTAIFILQDYKLVYYNEACMKIMELNLKPPFEYMHFIHPDDRDLVVRAVYDLFETDKNHVRFEARMVRKNQSIIYADLTLGLTLHNGKTAIIGTGIDVSSQKQMLENLRISESLLTDSQEITKTGTFTINRNSRTIWWSAQLYRIFDKSNNEPLAFNDFLANVHPGDRERVAYKLTDAIEHGKLKNMEFRLLVKGKVKFLKSVCRLTHNKSILQGTVQDITEYKGFERIISEHEYLTAEILNSFPIEIVIYNNDLSFQYVNKKAVPDDAIRAQIIGKSELDYCKIAGKPQVLAQNRMNYIKHTIETKSPFTWVEEVNNHGEVQYMFYGLYPIYENAELKRIVGSGIDLTKEMRAEKDLKFRVGFENILIQFSNKLINLSGEELDPVLNEGIATIGKFVQVDRVYLFKYNNQNSTLSNTHEWCSEGTPSFKDKLQNIVVDQANWWYKQVLRKKTIVIDHVDDMPESAAFERENFKRQNIKSLIAVPLVVDKKINGYIGFDSVHEPRKWTIEIQDLINLSAQIISSALERKTSFGALIQSEEKFRTLTESAHAAIFITMNTRFVYANPETCRLTGFDHDEILTRNIIDLLHYDEQPSASANLDKIMSNRAANSRNERKLVTKSGEIKYIDITSNKINYNGEEAMISIAFDVTEKHKKDEERINLIDQLTRQNQDLEQFSYITSHNLRSPVAGIKGLISIIEDDKIGSELNLSIIKRIETAAGKLDRVIRDLNDIISVKKEYQQNRQVINFNDLMYEIMEGHAVMISQSQAVINFNFSEAPKITTVKGYLQSIITNLLTNAIKYARQGTVPEIQIYTQKSGGKYIELVVQDNGTGIDLQKYGKKLFRFKQRFHLNIEGHGIGLYLVKTQAEALGGSIEVESEVNKGSKFIVRLYNFKK